MCIGWVTGQAMEDCKMNTSRLVDHKSFQKGVSQVEISRMNCWLYFFSYITYFLKAHKFTMFPGAQIIAGFTVKLFKEAGPHGCGGSSTLNSQDRSQPTAPRQRTALFCLLLLQRCDHRHIDTSFLRAGAGKEGES